MFCDRVGRLGAGRLQMNARLRPDAGDEAHEVLAPKRDAAFCRRVIFLSDVHEDCAAAPFDTWAVVVADDHNEVIETVGSSHSLSACWIRVLHRSVVVSVSRCVAPPVVIGDGSGDQGRQRPHDPVAPVQGAAERKDANRGSAVPFSFHDGRARSAAGAAHLKITTEQEALRGTAAQGLHNDVTGVNRASPSIRT